MFVPDKQVKVKVDVKGPECLKLACYWPRPDPGVFTQGRGYRQASYNRGWLCGHREIHGCPIHPWLREV